MANHLKSPSAKQQFASALGLSNGSASNGTPTTAYAALAAFAAEQEYRALANSDLSDRIILVVGASVDVAAATAVRLSKQGAQLILVDSSSRAVQERLTQLAAACDAAAMHGNKWHFRANKWQRVQKALVYPLENSSPASELKTLVTTVVDMFGRIDGLIFKAPNPTGPFSSSLNGGSMRDPNLLSTLDRTLTAEVLQFVQLLQIVVPQLEQTGGCVVNISTTGAIQPEPSQLSSSIARAMSDMLVKCLALELGPKKIRINSVNYVQTAPNPAQQSLAQGLEVNQSMMDQYLQQLEKDQGGQRLLRSDDVASAVLYLLSGRASFLNGVNLIVDGGRILQSRA